MVIRQSSAGDVARNILFTVLSNLYVPLSALATAPILARALNVDGRGVVAAATAPLILMTFIATLGIPELVTNLKARSLIILRRTRFRFELALVASGVTATLIIVAFSFLLAGGVSKLSILIQLCALAITPTLVVSYFRGVAAGLHRWRIVNLERYISSTVRLIGIVVAAVGGFLNVYVAIGIIAVAPICGAFAYVGVIRTNNSTELRHLPKHADGLEVAKIRPSIGYASRVWFGSLSGILLTRVSLLLITPLASSYQLGLYVAAVNVSDLALLANNAVRDVLFASDATERSFEKLARASRISFLISCGLGGFIAVTCPWWFGIVFGHEFRSGILPAVILVVSSVLGVPGSVVGAGLAARGRPGLRSASISVGAILTIVLLVFLVPPLGATGAAVATAVGGLVASILNIILAFRVFNWSPLECVKLRRSDFGTLKALVLRTLPSPTKRTGH